MQKLIAFITHHWLLASLFLITLVCLWVLEARAQGGVRLSVPKLVQLMNQEQAVVLDIRNEVAFQTGHITHSIHIPYLNLARENKKLEEYRARPIVLVCDRGQQSLSALNQLKKLGYSQLFILSGGIAAWRNAGYPLSQ